MNPSFCCLGNAHGGWQNNDIQQPHQLAAAVLCLLLLAANGWLFFFLFLLLPFLANPSCLLPWMDPTLICFGVTRGSIAADLSSPWFLFYKKSLSLSPPLSLSLTNFPGVSRRLACLLASLLDWLVCLLFLMLGWCCRCCCRRRCAQTVCARALIKVKIGI